ncbi:hypothetical protein B0T11DRAFT_277483 [Plectosphaerella cucumerina]|uniref:Zn(2)-C6 fungal-type domain-containing protein n=1 Tax=Plectosphaerella cucumerina TaxID=40658 RepID=A0A8K0X6U1_9PEZI|nr:hypothetical protein B0T11DRAFT_277483 [Plectosphaerella cucumerina]
MADSSTQPLRRTQRAPRSCLQCSARKVKCDKAVPCATCIRRGNAEACVRETVVVRGEVTRWDETRSSPSPSTQELQDEVVRLRGELDALTRTHGASNTSSRQSPLAWRSRKQLLSDPLEEVLLQSIASSTAVSKPRIHGWSDIILPNSRISDELIAFDEVWNSWVHFALLYPVFRQECRNFSRDVQDISKIETVDPFWLSVYFSVLCASLLMMDDAQAEKLLRSENITLGVTDLCRTWYDAAVFCLHKAEFMRVPHICTLQTVAILGMCFNIFGDADLGSHLRKTAIRIGRRLGMDTGHSERARPLSTEAQHRVWWTLLIVEWLTIPYEPSEVTEQDFAVPLPCPIDSAERPSLHKVDPAHYHAFMARTARVYHRFCRSVIYDSGPLEESVRAADDELAQIIETLPDHLQPDLSCSQMQEGECEEPWVTWQRFDVTLVLLHHRMAINRTLRHLWIKSPIQYGWARVVSIRSATDIIWISQNWNQPFTMRKQWALSSHLFSAALLLLRERKDLEDDQRAEYDDSIKNATSILEQVASRNAFAYHALTVLMAEVNRL